VQALLSDAGLPEPVAEFPVEAGGGRYRVDLAYPDALLAIELDDKETHLTDKAFEEDPIRENRLKLAGWLVLRYTWDGLVTDPNVIVGEVRAALRVRSCAA
jgi:very-short-patch-repair endonuclease